PDFAKNALDDLAGEAARLGRLPGFHEWLAEWVTQRVGAPVTAAALAALEIPDHLRMNLRVLDAEDRVLAEGRDPLAIKRKLYATAQTLHTAASVSSGGAAPAWAGVAGASARDVSRQGGGGRGGGGGGAGAEGRAG